MLSYSELKPGTTFIMDGQPYQILEYNFLRMQQRKPAVQSKIKNLKTGKVVQRTFHQNETFKEAEIEKRPVTYIYHNRGEYWFHKKNDPGNRFQLNEEILGNAAHFLKEKTDVTAWMFDDEVITVEIPIKIDLRVTDAPPGFKGDTAQGGSKEVVLETGYKINVPLFVNEGDIIRVNTTTGEYAERAEKA